MGANTLLIDLHFLPCLEYFTWLLAYDQVTLEICGNYQKQTYSNRCYMLSSQQIDRLTVPVLGGKKKVSYQDIQIDYHQKWPMCHWRSICTAYSKAPYFEYLSDHFQHVFFQEYKYLYQLNWALLHTCLDILQISKSIETTNEYMHHPPDSMVDVRGLIRPQVHFSKRNRYHPFPYRQVFGTIFNANLSILDLLFCVGSEAHHILKKSCTSSNVI